MDLADDIIRVLSETKEPLKARDLAAKLGVSRREVNSLLYRKLGSKVLRLDKYTWKLREIAPEARKELPQIARRLDVSSLTRAQRAFLVRGLKEFTYSTRIEGLIKTERLRRVMDLALLPRSQLLAMRNVGKKSANQIAEFLRSGGIDGEVQVDDWSESIAKAWETDLADDLVLARQQTATAARVSVDPDQDVTAELGALSRYLWDGQMRNAEITIALLGWDGKGAKTLEQVGDQYRITRERVRQVRNRFLQKIEGKQIHLPSTIKAIRVTETAIPELESVIVEKLVAQGLIGAPFDLTGLFTAADLLRENSDVVFVNFCDTRFVVRERHADHLRKAVSIARALVSKQGCVHIDDLRSRLSQQRSATLPLSFIRAVIATQNDIEWLDDLKEWFTLISNKRNRLKNIVMKVLCVAPRLPISELRASIKRVHRMGGMTPSTPVLKTFCEGLDICTLEGGYISATRQRDPVDVLGDTEVIFYQVLKEHGGLLTNSDFYKHCRNRGLNENTFFQYLSYSPIIHRIALGIYALPGASVPPGTLEAMADGRTPERVIEDHGWMADGRFWVAYRLNLSTIRMGAFSVPAAAKSFLSGEFSVSLGDGPEIGQIRSEGSRLTGLRNVIRLCGGEDDDLLRVIFDLSTKKANVSIIDEGLIDDPEPATPPEEQASKEDEELTEN